MAIEAITEERGSERREVLLSARCRKSSWIVHRVELNDLSEGGCCIIGGADGLELGQSVVIRFADLKGIPGTVRWVADHRAGVEFDSPVEAAVIAELGQVYGQAGGNVTDIKKYLSRD